MLNYSVAELRDIIQPTGHSAFSTAIATYDNRDTLYFDISMPYSMIIVYIKIIFAHYSNYLYANIRCFYVTSKFFHHF